MVSVGIPKEINVVVSVNGGEPERAIGLVWRIKPRLLLVRCEKSKLVQLKDLRVIECSSLSSANAIGHAPGAHGKATEPKLES
jgi:hypothetical protein